MKLILLEVYLNTGNFKKKQKHKRHQIFNWTYIVFFWLHFFAGCIKKHKNVNLSFSCCLSHNIFHKTIECDIWVIYCYVGDTVLQNIGNVCMNHTGFCCHGKSREKLLHLICSNKP